MKNLLMMISVALLVIGVVFLIKKRQSEPIYPPAFDAALPLESQPAGPFDGEYVLTSAKCPGKSGKEIKIPESQFAKIKIRGMVGKLFKKVGHCEIAQNLQISAQSEFLQFKQDFMECAPDCPCFPIITGVIFGSINRGKKEVLMTEKIRSEKEICDGKLPVTFKYAASVK